MEEVKKLLLQILRKMDGLHYILISDVEGVPFLKVSSENAPELTSRPALLSSFRKISEQGNKLGYGCSKCFICSYSCYQVVQMNHLSLGLVTTFVADIKANTGYIMTLESHLQGLLKDLKDHVIDRER